MKHLGDITLIHGNEIEPVDCVIGGSPCQDLSVAGKRAGLSGERSGLFMEQIRIVKEMRNRYGKPRYMVWENVPGAFSSNNGEDFRAVLEEVTRIADETTVIPRPPKGKWSYAGCIMGDGWSVAWRTHDAQFWGVPQRRRRIALVADFGGESAPEILFERESVSGDSESGGETREAAPGTVETSSAGYDRVLADGGKVPYTLKIRSGCPGGGKGALVQTNKCATLSTLQDQTLFQPVPMAMQAIGEYKLSNVLSSCKARDYKDATDLVCQAVSIDCRNSKVSGVAETLQARTGHTLNADGVVGQPAYCLQGNGIDRADTAGCNGRGWREDISYTLNTIDRPAVCYDMTHACDVIRDCGEVSPTLKARMGTDGNNVPTCIGNGQVDQLRMSDKVGTLNCMHDQQCVMLHYIVRRLTPLECERLQGFPSGWTDIGDWTDSKGKAHKAADTPRYKALGNSIALPFWFWMLHRMSEYLPIGATMGSLFDGIGGFPLLWEKIHGAGTARWASEIEEFAIAVTKIRFAEEATK